MWKQFNPSENLRTMILQETVNEISDSHLRRLIVRKKFRYQYFRKTQHNIRKMYLTAVNSQRMAVSYNNFKTKKEPKYVPKKVCLLFFLNSNPNSTWFSNTKSPWHLDPNSTDLKLHFSFQGNLPQKSNLRKRAKPLDSFFHGNFCNHCISRWFISNVFSQNWYIPSANEYLKIQFSKCFGLDHNTK